ncbi:type III pantothenate kinase [Bacteroides oleiciplenus]|uniref:Type III pantothenate kinase n=2 Tax=Bacteroides oleiciplenus TaxID=626931 RepID=K9EKX3_9BACE|nr:type III pantothenate kinase [Bacteroides oleiciplenus]EKU91607.1 type III pantothenate kinase [Bacteroides oleiciplenus YIT 12058]RGN30877.1 type III pantothenate kinase [Bacteroides oleiciplenus]
MNLVVDIGNTTAKLALFDGTLPLEVVYDSNSTLERLPDICSRYAVEKAIVASVIDLSERALAQLSKLPVPVLWLNEKTPLPVENLYETPETLGYDRMAAVVGANEQFPDRDILVIDAGTCITYEFVDASGRYHGGNISPGMQMRFRALHQFTGRLPLVLREGRELPMGRDTDTAIRAGVLKGMEYEISGYIVAMKHKYPELLVFLTGGDDFSFDTNLKSIIFADRFLVLKGLNRILNYNNDKI